MGFRRSAGELPVAQRQKEMRRRTQRKPLHPAETHRLVLGVRTIVNQVAVIYF